VSANPVGKVIALAGFEPIFTMKMAVDFAGRISIHRDVRPGLNQENVVAAGGMAGS